MKVVSFLKYHGWRAFIPHGVWLLGTLLLLVSVQGWRCWGLWGGMSALLVMFVAMWPEQWWPTLLKDVPVWSPGSSQRPDVVLVLGFGYEILQRKMKPGAANQFLIHWLETQTLAEKCLVQEGIWVGGTGALQRQWQRMHAHDENCYINTYEAFRSAWNHPWVLTAKQVMIVAHDLQLARAAWIGAMYALASGRTELQLMIPALPEVPMVAHPARGQWHTRFRFLFASVERWWSRPRDVWQVLKHGSIGI